MVNARAGVFIQSTKITRLLSAIVAVLVIAGMTSVVIRFKIGHLLLQPFARQFALDRENNIPTYFSTVLLLLAFLLLLIIAILKKRQGNKYALHWKMLAFVFLFLSLDEAASIHELVSYHMGKTLGTSGLLYYAWVIPATIFVGICGGLYRGFLLHLPTKTRRLFLLAALVYIGGALGVEFIKAYYADLQGESFTFNLIVVVQETLEMIGMVLFIRALLEYLSSTRMEICIEEKTSP